MPRPRASTSPPLGLSPQELDSRLIEAARDGQEPLLRALLSAGANPKAGSSAALRRAAEFGHERCALILAPLSDALAHDSEALRMAARAGLLSLARALIPHCDPQAQSNGALLFALKERHFECVLALLPHSAPALCESLALREAARWSDARCVAALLPFCDPSERRFEALRLACCRQDGHALPITALLLERQTPPPQLLALFERVSRACSPACADALLSRMESLALEGALPQAPSRPRPPI